MIAVKVEGENLVIRGLERACKDTIRGVIDGVEQVSDKITQHAADPKSHPHVTPGAAVSDSARRKNPDGSRRYFDRTGNLSGSIMPLDAKERRGAVEGGAVAGNTAVEYASRIEFGTERAKPFPFMRPARIAVEPTAAKIIQEAIDDRLG